MDIKQRFDYDFDRFESFQDTMSNKLFCTFATEDQLESTLTSIQEKYKILYDKIFVLYSK